MFTFPFAHANYTTVGDTLYYPEGSYPTKRTIEHEEIHSQQQKKYGLFSFLFKYIFVFPFVYNSFRYKMEYEAYKNANKYSDEKIHKILSSYMYGWLRKPKDLEA